jgi:5'-deoxynucleotidase YfbR-like HD superfamily hydrolase
MKKEQQEYKKFIKNDIATYSKTIDTLRHLVRYQNVQRIHNETVAEHSFIVSAFVLKLREYYTFNLEQALKTALIHDQMEASISDVPHNIKVANPALADTLEKAESNVINTMFSNEAAILIDNFNHGLTPEGLAVQLADVLSVVLHAHSEIDAGNKVFNYIAIKAIARCKEIVDKFDEFRNELYTKEQIINKINQIVNIY